MPVSEQSIQPGALREAFQEQFAELLSRDAVARLYSKDLSLWPAPAARRPGALDWLDLPERIGEYMRRVTARADAIAWENFDTILFVGMGSANLAAKAVASLFGGCTRRRLDILDTSEPEEIARVTEQLDLRRTFLIFAAKSGKLIETHALLLLLLNRLRELGVAQPGQQCVAVSEENSYLSILAKQYQFIQIFHDPTGIAGCYSGLIHFDLLLSSLCGVDSECLESQARSLKETCGPQVLPERNPALQLAALLSATATKGDSRVRLIGDTGLTPFLHVVANVLASSCRERQGIAPLIGENSRAETEDPDAGVTVAFRLGAAQAQRRSSNEETASNAADRSSATPSVHIQLASPETMGAEIFKWQVATALACCLMDVNPFQEFTPHRQRETLIRSLLAIATNGDQALPRIRVSESGIDLRAEAIARQEISTLSLTEALRTFLQFRRDRGYCTFLTFVAETEKNSAALDRVCARVASRIGTPVQALYGPRYLHSMSQVHRHGPPNGIFVMLTETSQEHVDVPGAGYEFGHLHRALALEDFEALIETGAPVIWLNLNDGTSKELQQLETTLQSALGTIRLGA